MKILVSHTTGNQFVRAVLTAFSEAGVLAGFHTTLAFDPNNQLLKWLPESLRKELIRRSYPLNRNQINTRPLLEIGRNLMPKIGMKNTIKHETGIFCTDRVYTDLDKHLSRKLDQWVERRQISAVYAYEDGALHTFIRAKELGLTCVYDLPIAYWETGRKLMQQEATRLPDWAMTLAGGISDSEEKLRRKTRELELADVVVVPGSFVLDSLPEWALNKKIIVAPFGSPENQLSFQKQTDKINKGRLKVLFAGSLGQRKGLGDLFEAIKVLDPTKVELILIGSLLAPLEFYKDQLENFIYEKSRPHEEVLELMASCDVFCLPSIVEGRALVMQEAMSQGLPVIITQNTGGADLVIEGETGFLVPTGCPEQIAEKLNWCINNRERLKEMGTKAKLHAENYSWKKYGDQIVKELKAYAS